MPLVSKSARVCEICGDWNIGLWPVRQAEILSAISNAAGLETALGAQTGSLCSCRAVVSSPARQLHGNR